MEFLRYLRIVQVKTSKSMERKLAKKSKKIRPIWRCADWKCATSRSIATCNDFFAIPSPDEQRRRQLSLIDIMTIAWTLAYSGMSQQKGAKSAEVCKSSIYVWYRRCRSVFTASQTSLPKMTGTTAEHRRVDESYFSGRRQYNRGRLRRGGRIPSNQATAQGELQIELTSWGDPEPTIDELDELDGRPSRHNNYQERFVGP